MTPEARRAQAHTGNHTRYVHAYLEAAGRTSMVSPILCNFRTALVLFPQRDGFTLFFCNFLK